MNTHTPGPWTLEPVLDQRGDETVAVYSAQGLFITYALPRVSACAELAANARLIAAAPDLLAALEDVMSDPYFAEASTRYVHARQAIAAARGA